MNAGRKNGEWTGGKAKSRKEEESRESWADERGNGRVEIERVYIETERPGVERWRHGDALRRRDAETVIMLRR